MRVRNDMKNNRLFNSAVKKYRKKSKINFFVMSILSFFFICVVGFIANGLEEGFTEDWETFSRIQEGNVYYFLCRGKKIVDIVSKESFY